MVPEKNQTESYDASSLLAAHYLFHIHPGPFSQRPHSMFGS